MYVAEDDSTTTTETTEGSAVSCRGPANANHAPSTISSVIEDEQQQDSQSQVSSIRSTSETLQAATTPNEVLRSALEVVEDGSEDSLSSAPSSTFNEGFGMPVANSNFVDMEVPVKDDGFLEDSVRYTHNRYAKFGSQCSNQNATPSKFDQSEQSGSEIAAPDVKPHYGYGNAAPSNNDMFKYGYGDAAPDDKTKYGYGDGAPSMRSSPRRRLPRRRRTCGDDDSDDEEEDMSRGSAASIRSTQSAMSTSRRSSIRKAGAPRRASIQFGGEISVYLPGKEEPVRRRTSIKFDESVRVKQVAAARKLTADPEKLWFQKEEFQAIRRRSLDLVHKVESGQTDGKRYCIRGLEKLMKNRRRQSMEHKYNAWDSVLDEQDVQRGSGTWDEEYMANMYSDVTSQPKEEAAVQGQKDHTDIENYMKSTRNLCRRLSM